MGYFRGQFKVKTDGDKTLRILNPEWTVAALDMCVVHASPPPSSRPFPFFRNQEARGTGDSEPAAVVWRGGSV